MKDFLNLAQSISVRTQRPFSARVRDGAFLPAAGAGKSAGVKGRDGVLQPQHQLRAQDPTSRICPPSKEICVQSLCMRLGPAWGGDSRVRQRLKFQ